MGKLSRTKGHAWERAVAKLFSFTTSRPYKRVLSESRDGNSGDVSDGSPNPWPVAILARNASGKRPRQELAVLRLEDFLALLGGPVYPPWVIQCKIGQRIDVFGALDEAVEAAEKGEA